MNYKLKRDKLKAANKPITCSIDIKNQNLKDMMQKNSQYYLKTQSSTSAKHNRSMDAFFSENSKEMQEMLADINQKDPEYIQLRNQFTPITKTIDISSCNVPQQQQQYNLQLNINSENKKNAKYRSGSSNNANSSQSPDVQQDRSFSYSHKKYKTHQVTPENIRKNPQCSTSNKRQKAQKETHQSQGRLNTQVMNTPHLDKSLYNYCNNEGMIDKSSDDKGSFSNSSAANKKQEIIMYLKKRFEYYENKYKENDIVNIANIRTDNYMTQSTESFSENRNIKIPRQLKEEKRSKSKERQVPNKSPSNLQLQKNQISNKQDTLQQHQKQCIQDKKEKYSLQNDRKSINLAESKQFSDAGSLKLNSSQLIELERKNKQLEKTLQDNMNDIMQLQMSNKQIIQEKQLNGNQMKFILQEKDMKIQQLNELKQKMSKTNLKYEEQIQQKDSEINERDSKIQQLEQVIQQQDDIITKIMVDQKSDMDNKDHLKDQIQRKDGEIKMLAQELQEQAGKLSDQNQIILSKDEVMQQYQNELQEKIETIQSKDEMLVIFKKEQTQKNEKLENCRTQIKNFEQQFQQKNEQLEKIQYELNLKKNETESLLSLYQYQIQQINDSLQEKLSENKNLETLVQKQNEQLNINNDNTFQLNKIKEDQLQFIINQISQIARNQKSEKSLTTFQSLSIANTVRSYKLDTEVSDNTQEKLSNKNADEQIILSN